MTDRTSDEKERDKFLINRAIASINKAAANGRTPSSGDLATIEAMAAKYPQDGEIQRLLQEAAKVIEAAREVIEKSSAVGAKVEHEAYSEKEYKALLKKEDDYFEKSQERHELLDKILSVESFVVKEIAELYHETVQEKDERKASTELISYDLSKFNKAAASGEDLSEEEQRRRRQANKRLETVLKEELFTAIVSNQVEIYAHEARKKAEDVSLDEVILARGDIILAEFKAAIPMLKKAFHGAEEKLAALMFHSPEAIKEHHGNIEQLHREAEKAHEKQMEFVRGKIEENKVQEAVTTKLSTDTIAEKDAGGEKLSQEDALLAKMEAKKAAAGSLLPPPKYSDSSTVVDSSAISAPKPIRDVKSPAKNVSKDRLK